MLKEKQGPTVKAEATISIIGPGMTIIGDVDTDGSVRVEGTVKGTVRAGKAVVVGREGMIEGSVFTQDAVIAGAVEGNLTAQSRLELQAESKVDGDIVAHRIQLEEGAVLNGTVQMGATQASAGELSSLPLDPDTAVRQVVPRA